MRRHILRLLFVLLGFIVGAVAMGPLGETTEADQLFAAEPASDSPDLAALAAEVKRLKGMVPSQSHSMMDVDYHFTNLWFAGQSNNWPLAQFYLNETKSHLRWAVRIIPVRKDKSGAEIKLADILEAVENSPLKQLDESIKAEDQEKFVAAYKFTLTSCYACHKAADKPYLRPQIPVRPATKIINIDPSATWPQ
ncbi:hypothetical protein GC197_03255 [bacterium]|nr:hypothetical protein [bacterium]